LAQAGPIANRPRNGIKKKLAGRHSYGKGGEKMEGPRTRNGGDGEKVSFNFKYFGGGQSSVLG